MQQKQQLFLAAKLMWCGCQLMVTRCISSNDMMTFFINNACVCHKYFWWQINVIVHSNWWWGEKAQLTWWRFWKQCMRMYTRNNFQGKLISCGWQLIVRCKKHKCNDDACHKKSCMRCNKSNNYFWRANWCDVDDNWWWPSAKPQMTWWLFS